MCADHLPMAAEWPEWTLRQAYPISRFFSCRASHLLLSCRVSSWAASTCTKHSELLWPLLARLCTMCHQAGPAGAQREPRPTLAPGSRRCMTWGCLSLQASPRARQNTTRGG